MKTPRYAFFRLAQEDLLGCETFARDLIDVGFTILSTQGTYDYLDAQGVHTTLIDQVKYTLVGNPKGFLRVDDKSGRAHLFCDIEVFCVTLNTAALGALIERKEETRLPEFRGGIDIEGEALINLAIQAGKIVLTNLQFCQMVLNIISGEEPDASTRLWHAAMNELERYARLKGVVYLNFFSGRSLE